MKSSELRGLPVAELATKEGELKKELFNLKIQHATGQAENPIRLRVLRREIARTRTIIGEKERETTDE